MGEETLAKLFRAGYNTLRRILDITFEEIVRIDGFGDSIANVILDANKKIREGVEVTRLMHASDCFLGIGQVKAKSILSDLSDSDRFAFINGCVQTEAGFDQTPEFLAPEQNNAIVPKRNRTFLRLCCRKQTNNPSTRRKGKTCWRQVRWNESVLYRVRDKCLEDEDRIARRRSCKRSLKENDPSYRWRHKLHFQQDVKGQIT